MWTKFKLGILLFSLVFTSVKCSDSDENVISGIYDIFTKIKLDEIKAFLLKELANEKHNSITCLTQLLMIVQGLQNGELWALKCKFKFNR